MIENFRKEYKKAVLSKSNLLKNPIEQFKEWLNFALAQKIDEPNAMHLCTVNKLNKPSSRIVLLREITENTFVFYTNYNSKKAKNIIQNNNVSICFFWKTLQKQIRIEGTCQKTTEQKSDDYFYSRPIESQLASMASPQSKKIENKNTLLNFFKDEKQKYAKSNKIIRPKNWGGFEILPNYFEFWQGGEHRLHDRFCYQKENENWQIDRLAP